MKIKVFKDLKNNSWGIAREEWKILKQSSSRDWLDNTGTVESNSKGYGNKCLPLKIANQLGWYIPFPTDVTCYYNSNSSKVGRKALEVKVADKKYEYFFKSHFGSGILTIGVPIIFKTKRNRQLYVRGPTNSYKDGVMYMDGVIETDWMNFKFTYNIKILKQDTLIEFKKGEPIFSFIPINLQEIDESYIKECSIYTEPLMGFFASMYTEKRLTLMETHGKQYLHGAKIAMQDKSEEEIKKGLDDEGYMHNIKDHYWMKDYFLGGWEARGKKKNDLAPKDLLGPEIGCPYLHFISLKREKAKFNLKKIIIKPFKLVRFYLFRNIFFFKLFLRKKILKNDPLTKLILISIKNNFPEKLYNKIIGNLNKK